MRMHGGHIALKSELNRGTTFTVYLPQTDDLPANYAGVASSVGEDGRPCPEDAGPPALGTTAGRA